MGKPGFPNPLPEGRVWEGFALPRIIIFIAALCAPRMGSVLTRKLGRHALPNKALVSLVVVQQSRIDG